VNDEAVRGPAADPEAPHIGELRFTVLGGCATLFFGPDLSRGRIMSTVAARTDDNEVTILARVFDDDRGLLPRALARAIVDAEFSERDKARMHDLAVRNQNDALSPREKEELIGFATAGTLLSILQSKARRTLKIK
jgi:hypothetical protein